MKGYKKIMIIGISILIGLIALLFLTAMFKSKSEYSKMTPLDSGEVISGVYTVNNGHVNFYLVKHEDGYIAIDAGNNLKISKEEMDKLGINPKDVTTVLLTHTDSDHVASVELFENAKVYISEKEEQMINGETPRQLIFGNKLNAEYSTLGDNEKIEVSNITIEGRFTPGHTPGSMSYILDDKYLFAGDSLSLKDGKAQLFNEFFNMDNELQNETINKISEFNDIEYIFTGHYGYTDDFKKAFNK